MSAVVGFKAMREPLQTLYRTGMKPGASTGWKCVDRLFTVSPGQMTVVSGWPGSGKSEWTDAVAVNTAKRGWRWAIFSPENYPVEIHQSKILEKLVGKPFAAGPTPRMSPAEIATAQEEWDDRFGFINPKTDTALSVQQVMGFAADWFDLVGHDRPKGLIVDPWNELGHDRVGGETETEYISLALSYVRKFARDVNVHVFLVAHPAKQRRDDSGKLPVPRPDMIAGSQHWWNKADNAITVYRSPEEGVQDVDIHVQKIRFKHIGRVGMATLKYDRITGTYFEPMTGTDSHGREVMYSYARAKDEA